MTLRPRESSLGVSTGTDRPRRGWPFLSSEQCLVSKKAGKGPAAAEARVTRPPRLGAQDRNNAPQSEAECSDQGGARQFRGKRWGVRQETHPYLSRVCCGLGTGLGRELESGPLSFLPPPCTGSLGMAARPLPTRHQSLRQSDPVTSASNAPSPPPRIP